MRSVFISVTDFEKEVVDGSESEGEVGDMEELEEEEEDEENEDDETKAVDDVRDVNPMEVWISTHIFLCTLCEVYRMNT